jgi:hypothetical protein
VWGPKLEQSLRGEKRRGEGKRPTINLDLKPSILWQIFLVWGPKLDQSLRGEKRRGEGRRKKRGGQRA